MLATINPKRLPLRMVSSQLEDEFFFLAIDVDIDLSSSLPRMKGALVSTAISRTTIESKRMKKF